MITSRLARKTAHISSTECNYLFLESLLELQERNKCFQGFTAQLVAEERAGSWEEEYAHKALSIYEAKGICKRITLLGSRDQQSCIEGYFIPENKLEEAREHIASSPPVMPTTSFYQDFAKEE